MQLVQRGTSACQPWESCFGGSLFETLHNLSQDLTIQRDDESSPYYDGCQRVSLAAGMS